MLFTEWRDDGTVEAVHHDHGQHHQHPGVVLTEPELVGGRPVDRLDVGGGGGETEVDDVPAVTIVIHRSHRFIFYQKPRGFLRKEIFFQDF